MCILQAKIKRNPSIPEDTRGVINLTINYDPNAGILTVRLIEVNIFISCTHTHIFFNSWLFIFCQANDLQPRDFSGTADPYAKIRLLPDKTNFWQTKIHKRTLNPSMFRNHNRCFFFVLLSPLMRYLFMNFVLLFSLSSFWWGFRIWRTTGSDWSTHHWDFIVRFWFVFTSFLHRWHSNWFEQIGFNT